ncbi:MAG: D-alanyl-D-alanine carboxypeptidase/D-alanyl-D-alanine-endopeptidase [Xenococcaceae cyanobacterium MO_188.B19]|nr:D-alanyl-D-alanine carboxypeptidase/D-alanyl-D-alanine-endopeptidase [Xenococcaceae cyanobacterium MO_188.B19]
MFKQCAFGKLIFCIFTINFLLPSIAEADEKPVSVCTQNLSLEIDSIIDRPEFSKSRWGILVKNLDSGKVIYSRDRDKYFIPASNVKLFTSASALLELGTEFRIKTPIYATGNLPNLTTLQVKGKGDPTISSESLKNIVQQLQTLGIKRIEKLIIEDSYFPQNPLNPTWEWSDIYYYYAVAVNSIILNENTVTLTLLPQNPGEKVRFRWSDTIAARQWNLINQGITASAETPYNIDITGVLGKPTLKIQGELPKNNQPDDWDLAILDTPNYFLETLRLFFFQSGIKVNQGQVVKEALSIPESRIIVSIFSQPLKKIIQEINQESNNLYAEIIANILANKLNTKTGTEAIQEVLNQLKIDSDSYILEDSSGLSRHSLVTPEVLVDLLTKMSQTRVANVYKESFALAGVEGTLKNRLENIPGKLWAKTGTLSGVNNLSGYLELPNNETLVFSILVNNFQGERQLLQKEINKIFTILSSLSKECKY